MLAQYCMHMAIRSAYWNYDTAMHCEDKLIREKAYAVFCDVFDKYSSLITLPYFLSDIIEYRIDVEY